MKFQIVIFAGLLVSAFASTASAQVYRCKSAGGMVMQQVLCAGEGQKLDVRPASGHMSAEQAQASMTASVVSGARPMSRVELSLDAAQKERLRREGWFDMMNKKAGLERLVRQCAIDQQRISDGRAYSRNNLAGATRDVSITNEMKAAAAVCDTQTRSFEREVDQAVAHCETIKCIAQN